MARFDAAIERRGSDSYKWDGARRVFGREGLLPFWVADMDFATPGPIVEAMRRRLGHPVFGYEERGDEYLDAVLDWLADRHGWRVPRDWLHFCPPSSIVAIYGLIVTLTAPGSSIAVPTPTYGPLIDLVADNDRVLLRNPLREVSGRFVPDVDGLRKALRDDTRMLLLCNPHNPTGRVFTRAELEELAGLAAERDLIVVSDEVHCDLVLPGHRHVPFASLGWHRSVSVISPNKPFNTAGIPQSTLITPDAEIGAAFERFLGTSQLRHDSTFGAVAMIAAYRHCAEWLDELIAYLAGNHERVCTFLEDEVRGVRVIPAEATYLAWLDYRELGIDEDEVQRRLTEEGGVALYGGTEFGEEGRGFLRMNVACPRAQLERGLEGIRKALA